MGVLKDLETLVITAEQLREAGVPSISMAFLDNPLSPIQHHVITTGEENHETIYQACSISKPVTALAVARLVDQGKLEYDTRIIDHVPKSIITAIVDDTNRNLLQHVTIAMLLSHRSGLTQGGFPGYVGEPPGYQAIFSGKPPSNTPRIRFQSFPGSHYSYSGGGFVLLQILLEEVTGQHFADLMQETVLHPLNMTRSRFGDAPPGDNNYARAHLTAYTPGTSSTRGYHRFTELAAAGLWTTPSDLVRLTSAVQKSLSTQIGFLTPATARKMLTLVAPHDRSQMGLGWAVDDTFFAHAGENYPGYTCYLLSTHTISSALPPNINHPRLTSLCLMTNSLLGRPLINKLVAAIFALRGCPLYDSLPSFGNMSALVPFPSPEGVPMGVLWREYIGIWTAARQDAAADGRKDAAAEEGTGTWEIFENEDAKRPMMAFEGCEHGFALVQGMTSSNRVDGGACQTLVVVGLDVAVRLCSRQKVDWGSEVPFAVGVESRSADEGVARAEGEKQDEAGIWIEIVVGDRGEVKVLRRVGS